MKFLSIKSKNQTEPSWEVNPSDYEFNASISANVTNNDVEVTSGILAAFVGDEVRGVSKSEDGKWLVFPPTGKTVVSLTVLHYNGQADKDMRGMRASNFECRA